MSTMNTDPLTRTSFPETDTHSGSMRHGIRDRMSGLTHQARDKAAEVGRQTVDRIDRNIDSAAGKLQSTASSLRSRAGAGSQRFTGVANAAADRLEHTADYFRSHHTREMMDDAGRMIRRNPAASMAVALGVGFLIGCTMRRDRG